MLPPQGRAPAQLPAAECPGPLRQRRRARQPAARLAQPRRALTQGTGFARAAAGSAPLPQAPVALQRVGRAWCGLGRRAGVDHLGGRRGARLRAMQLGIWHSGMQ